MKEFTKKIIDSIECDYQKALSFLGSHAVVIEEKMKKTSGLESLFMKYLYAYIPISDAGAYDFEVYLGYAEHAVFLLNNSPYIECIPEEYFLNYVLSERINSEDIIDCRRFFYDQVIDRIQGMSMEEAVQEINNWCYENATYRSTSTRTASPVTVYKSGFGRCGEESTLTVTVLRSVGIPARQIYVPRWSHSDSNHAWIEAWLGDRFSYTGACEPQPVMYNGWFTYAASRAMIVHSRLTSNFGFEDSEVVERDGVITAINHIDMYAKSSPLKVLVVLEDETPVTKALVRFEVVNGSEFFPIAALTTNDTGNVSIRLGLGEVMIEVLYQGVAVTRFVDNKTEDEVKIIIKEKKQPEEWQRYHLTAPDPSVMYGVELTKEQKEWQKEKNEKADMVREARIASYYDEQYAEQYKEYPCIMKCLKESKGNFDEIKKFLEGNGEKASLKQKNDLLSTLKQKDCSDILASTLFDWLSSVIFESNYKEEIFVPYVLAGGIFMEMHTPYKSFISAYFGEKGSQLVKDPLSLWEWIHHEITYYKEKEYVTIFNTPKSVLLTKAATLMSQKILFVAICRTFGLPSRLDPIYLEPQYYDGEEFVFVDKTFEAQKGGILTLLSEEETDPINRQNFTIGHKQTDGSYKTLKLHEKKFEDHKLVLNLAAGNYRIVTCDRMNNGSIIGKMYHLELKEGDEKKVNIRTSELTASEFMMDIKVPEIILFSHDGNMLSSKDFKEDDKTVLLFVEPGQEPTEHLFNEMLEIVQVSGFVEADLNLILKKESLLMDQTYQRILKAFPMAKVWLMNSAEVLNVISETSQIDTSRLPVIAVMKGRDTLVYAVSGYQVGSADILARILYYFK